jgi:hypothetical protein
MKKSLTSLKAVLTAALCCGLVVCTPSVAIAQPSISLSVGGPGVSFDSSTPPNPASVLPRDWLTDATLLVWPKHFTELTLTISPTVVPLTPNYSGKLNVTTRCCGVLGWPGLVNPGVGAAVDTGKPGIPSNVVEVNGSPVQRSFKLSPWSTSLPGDWVMQIRAQDGSQNIDKATDVLLKVLPAWPDDGIASKCKPTLETLKLSSLMVYDWKSAHLSAAGYSFGANFTSFVGGFTVFIHKPSTPLPPNTAFITFKHNVGWHVGIRNDNSNNCAASGTTKVVEAGQSVSFLISASDTTTLVFSRPVCRADYFGICFQVGLDDMVQFSEGPFWTLFGGHQVDIVTVWDWGEDPGDIGLGVIEPPGR